ncbi:hypothetical protein LY90DRAFT_676906 [Neocallimastix californiae]|uniref:ABC transporter domain-containing protein n=1 Tax=Neocallimastix californiae TaxID=1754190 RepID=A0A1Y2ACK1_9FUNG|nr:hypothetical protein LY90DRAFT_676906 [Neocallimastix californiae]|eukprot:ORY20194.1 hypothetical protein LY90DRAFT_676906 [Neocallimastix californiae]
MNMKAFWVLYIEKPISDEEQLGYDYIKKYEEENEAINTVIGFVLPQNVNRNISNIILTNLKEKSIFYETNVDLMYFENEKLLEEYYMKESKALLAGIIFNSDLSCYKIRVAGNSIPNPHYFTNNDETSLIRYDAYDYFPIFAPIQFAIDKTLIYLKTNETNANKVYNYNIKLDTLAYLRYQTQNYSFVNVMIICLIEFIFVVPLLESISQILTEKQNKSKEYLLTLGVSPFCYWMSWIITNISVLYIISTILSIILFIVKVISTFSFYSYSSLFVIIALLFIYPISIVNICFLLSIIQKIPRVAYVISFAFLFVFSFLFIIVQSLSSTFQVIGSIFFSSISMGRALNRWKHINSSLLQSTSINILTDKVIIVSFLCLVWNCVFYFLLALLFDYLISKESNSFISLKRKSRSNKRLKSLNINSTNSWKEDIENYQCQESSYIDVQNIVKGYPESDNNYIEVDNISFKAYRNEILSIVGHNESGKSSIINMLIGKVPPDYGNIYYDGQDLKTNKKSILNNTGICLQDIALFESFSVMKNLYIYTEIKGKSNENLENILKILSLNGNSKVKKLTNDEKRLLCLGIAILGHPKYLILDEPMAGLSRPYKRKICNILSVLKKKRIVIFTTHDIKEADILADRKLILSKGKIRCYGSKLKNLSNEEVIKDYFIEPPSLEELYMRFNEEEEQKNDENSDSDSENESIDLNDDSSLIIDGINISKESANLSSLHQIIDTEINDNEKLLTNDYTTLPEPVPTKHISSLTIFLRLVRLKYKIYFGKKLFIFKRVLMYREEKDLSYTSVPENIQWGIFTDTLTIYNQTDLNNNIPLQNILKIYKDLKKNFININMKTDQNEIIKQQKNLISFINVINNNLNDDMNNFYFDLFYNRTISNSLPTSMNFLSNLVLDMIRNNNTLINEANLNNNNNNNNNIVNINDNPTKIRIINHPFPYINTQFTKFILNNVNLILNFVLLLGVVSYAKTVAYERKKLIIIQLRLNGVNRSTYWIASLITDVSIYIMTCLIVLMAALFCKYEPFYNFYAILFILANIILNALATVLFQYSISFLFNNSKIIYSNLLYLNLILLMIYFLIGMKDYSNYKYESTLFFNNIFKKDNIYSDFVMIIIYPLSSLGLLMNSLSWMKYLNTIDAAEYPLTFTNYWNKDNGIKFNFLGAGISIIFYFIIIMTLDRNYIEKRKIKKNYANSDLCDMLHEERYSNYPIYIEDSALNEYLRVNEKYNEFPISVLRLNKEFHAKPENCHDNVMRTDFAYGEIHRSMYTEDITFVQTIIEHVSFHVNYNECFGLLGPDNVGKTTILDTLAGITEATYGDIYYDGQNIKTIPDLKLGYCNQSNIFWEELTLRDHLELFLELRGYPLHCIKKEAEHYIRFCHLEKYQFKPMADLSISIKRKCSVLLALCGYPKYVILDEPTREVDSHIKHEIWKLIQDAKHKKQSTSFILATNAMDEAEALCDRVSFLQNGIISCYGTPDSLIKKYVNCYVFIIETATFREFLQTLFENPSSVLSNIGYSLERQSLNRYKFYIENRLPIGNMFDVLESVKNQGIISDYTLYDPNLETLFLIIYQNLF